MGAMAKAKRAGGAHPVVGDGDADVAEDGGGRSTVAMVGLAVAAIFFIWFAVANLNKVKINFWIYDKSEPLDPRHPDRGAPRSADRRPADAPPDPRHLRGLGGTGWGRGRCLR